MKLPEGGTVTAGNSITIVSCRLLLETIVSNYLLFIKARPAKSLIYTSGIGSHDAFSTIVASADSSSSYSPLREEVICLASRVASPFLFLGLPRSRCLPHDNSFDFTNTQLALNKHSKLPKYSETSSISSAARKVTIHQGISLFVQYTKFKKDTWKRDSLHPASSSAHSDPRATPTSAQPHFITR